MVRMMTSAPVRVRYAVTVALALVVMAGVFSGAMVGRAAMVESHASSDCLEAAADAFEGIHDEIVAAIAATDADPSLTQGTRDVILAAMDDIEDLFDPCRDMCCPSCWCTCEPDCWLTSSCCKNCDWREVCCDGCDEQGPLGCLICILRQMQWILVHSEGCPPPEWEWEPPADPPVDEETAVEQLSLIHVLIEEVRDILR